MRIQWGLYGGKAETMNTPPYSQQGAYFNPGQYMKDTVKMFEYIRDKFGDDVELLHDCHERLTPSDAVYLAKKLEQYRLFFLEDVLPPEQGEWIKHIKSQTTTPIAIGELFNNPKEWEYLISNRLIDYVRVHISQIGGITPARKLATLCEQFGIRTAWHGPGDVSPIGHAANIHLDLAVHNFGIQEWCGFDDVMYEVFPGTPQLKNGYLHVSAAPGLGIKINEKLAEKYPAETKVTTWTQTRLPDGTLVNP